MSLLLVYPEVPEVYYPSGDHLETIREIGLRKADLAQPCTCTSTGFSGHQCQKVWKSVEITSFAEFIQNMV